MQPRGYGCILLCVVLLAMAALPAAALPENPSVPVPLAGIGVPNVLQEKGKLQYTAEDFAMEGKKAADSGNYEDAIKYYNKAEKMLVDADPGRSSSTDFSLYEIEYDKWRTYQMWGGHEAEEGEAWDKANELKDSSSKKAGVSKGCLIVTATFGSPLAGEVQLVRSFRDNSIVKSYTGSRFMPGFNAWYYSFSPQVSTYISKHPVVRPAMQVLIAPILEIVLFAQACYTFLSFNPELATIAAILVGSALYGIIYVFPTAMAGVWVARRRGWKGGNIRSLWPAALVWVTLLFLIIAGVAFSFDLLTTISSGLFVIATIILVVAALSVSLLRYIGRKDAVVQE